ncbi:LOW QUALITY PROTEIN: Reverse transcriptase, RNA-dependent DNA polymerase [Dillenia turbinata]|uniref:Reverse transcriptase, RNA-dependent DNA polymerase n=1 Tax=Dillenia turbinata TaxID=194707 RepID=A0AAN8Z8N5_9MAGN
MEKSRCIPSVVTFNREIVKEDQRFKNIFQIEHTTLYYILSKTVVPTITDNGTYQNDDNDSKLEMCANPSKGDELHVYTRKRYLQDKEGLSLKQNQESNSREKLNLNQVILIASVDDIILTGDDIDEMDRLKKCLASQLEIRVLGSLRYFLKMEVPQTKRGIMAFQRKYVLDLPEETSVSGCRPVETLIDPTQNLGDDKKGRNKLSLIQSRILMSNCKGKERRMERALLWEKRARSNPCGQKFEAYGKMYISKIQSTLSRNFVIESQEYLSNYFLKLSTVSSSEYSSITTDNFQYSLHQYDFPDFVGENFEWLNDHFVVLADQIAAVASE